MKVAQGCYDVLLLRLYWGYIKVILGCIKVILRLYWGS